ncbi:MAG: hypothetical protein KF696_06720 [Planctomycetes bacterium]|nr:hypothetical protein [Planctomycetota bacterium]MCW8137182.1 hypothetical protein [Planctomycetota bacterium]
MPYIKQDQRQPLDPLIEQLAALLPEKDFAGTLNYVIARLASNLLAKQTNYARINEIIGALECAKQELYRRAAAPYEDQKAKENGDVF